MAQFGSNGYGYYFGQGLNGSAMSEFTMSQQQYGQHRASDPLGSLELSQLERVGRELPLQDLTKPEHSLPFDGQFRHGVRQQQHFSPPFWQSNVHGTGARTEPVPNQDIYIERPRKGSEVSDSAYASMPASTGVHDNFNANKQELEQGYFAAFKSEHGSEAHLPTSHISHPDPPQSVKSEGHYLTPQHKDSRRRQPLAPCDFPGCGRRAKNPSDAKKHALTHIKPHRCTFPGCERKEGFATDNDLQRHRKSVHNLVPTVGSPAGYICAACRNPESAGAPKFWPRRDNFKAHIKRKHLDWNETQLIEISKQSMRPDDARTVEDDNKSIRSAMRSSRHSQGDHADLHHYQMSPNMSRNVSDQSEFTNNIFPDSAIDMQQDNFAGMGGHTTDTDVTFPPYAMGSADPSDMLSSSNAEYGASIMPTSPFKKPKLNHDAYLYDTASTPLFQMTVSDHGTASSASNSQSTATSSSVQGEFRCPECSKVKRRECDLKKHMKRHTRPYGCTFPGCHKKFGSRNDWKRHESSQHFLHEMWKCERPRHDGTPCTRRPFRDIEALKRHLRGEDHLLRCSEPQILEECRRYLLGREGHERFWCGFCQRLVSQEKALQNAWDARFKHIGDHFDKEGLDSGDWVCVEENKRKKYIVPPQSEDGGGRKEGKRRNSKLGEKREEEEPELPTFNPGGAVGANGFVDMSGYGGNFECGYLGAGNVDKRKQSVDVDADGESDDEMQ